MYKQIAEGIYSPRKQNRIKDFFIRFWQGLLTDNEQIALLCAVGITGILTGFGN